MSNYFKTAQKTDVIYPPLKPGLFCGREYTDLKLIESIDKNFYNVTMTANGFMVHKIPAVEILRKNTTPLGFAISRVFTAMGRFSKAQYLSDLKMFESQNGFLEPGYETESDFQSDNFESDFEDDQVDLEKVYDQILPSASGFAAICARAAKSVAENKPRDRDSGWMPVCDNGYIPPNRPEINEFVTQGQCSKTGKRYYRISSKPILENA